MPVNVGQFQGQWPRKYLLFGVGVSETDYEEARSAILAAALKKLRATVAHINVHLLMAASEDPSLGALLNSFDMATPDGQPVRWALNHFHHTKLLDTVSGPDLMLMLCREAAESGIGIYLYGGSSPKVVETLRANLQKQSPSLNVAGCESPPFRPLTREEDRAVVDRMNSSGAGIVFIGLGAPKQEWFAFEHREAINAVQLCVGGAFDYHAGIRKRVPKWVRERGLEWFFRLVQEPRRLGRRYFVTNSLFLWKCLVASFR